MRQWIYAVFALLAGVFAMAMPAHAQATRTWVSGVGDDVNPCSRTAPCKTFAGAISKTAAGGEINCLDPGGYGTVTITKSITIDCGTAFGSILASATNGINVNASSTDVVRLRNISINGAGTTLGLNGVNILAGATVILDHLVISNFSQSGIVDGRTSGTPRLHVIDTALDTMASGSAILLSCTVVCVSNFDNVHVLASRNGIGIANNNRATVRNSVFSGSSNIGAVVDSGGFLMATGSEFSNGNFGLQASGFVLLADSVVSLNATAATGTVITYGNNRFPGNTALGSATFTAAGAATSDLGQK